MNKILLKRKLHEKNIIENKLLTAYRLKDAYLVRELNYDLILVEKEIYRLQNK